MIELATIVAAAAALLRWLRDTPVLRDPDPDEA